LVIVTHEDSTHLSRLGGVWSVVEPDELGALHLWGQGDGGGWMRVHSHTFGIKARSLAWEDATRQFFVGLEDGKIEVHAVPQGSLRPGREAVLELHHKTPVTHLSASSRHLLSLGFDTAMRVIDIRTRQLVCGGRLMKRLRGESDYLSCGGLDDETDRAFIGTSGGDVLIFDVAMNPPNFLHTLELDKPVSAMAIAREQLFIAHSDCISVMGLQAKGQEAKTAKVACHRVRNLGIEDASILSVAVAPERDLLFGGFSDGSVAAWSPGESEALMVLKAHQCDAAQLAWVESPPWGPSLFTGGGDGKVTAWHLAGGSDDYFLWRPQGVASEDLASQAGAAIFGAGAGDGADPFAPAFGNSGDVFRMDNPRVNPQALRRDDESDSDNDIADAFR